MSNIQKIKSHFNRLGFLVKLVSSKVGGKEDHHWLYYRDDEGDPERLLKLVHYYFGSHEHDPAFSRTLIKLDDFHRDGHAITGICRKCGCTQDDACHDHETGSCWWVEQDLCSACATVKEKNEALASMHDFLPDEDS